MVKFSDCATLGKSNRVQKMMQDVENERAFNGRVEAIR